MIYFLYVFNILLNIYILVLNIDILLVINIYILLKNIDLLDIGLNIDILALNIGILLDILNNDILSSYWKRGKYKFFILFLYPNRGNKTNGGWGELLWTMDVFDKRVCCVVSGLCGMVLGCRMYNRNSYGGSSERCLSGVVGLLRSLS